MKEEVVVVQREFWILELQRRLLLLLESPTVGRDLGEDDRVMN